MRKLPRRAFNSPCIKFANFEDGKYNLNLIRMSRNSYAISNCTEYGFMSKTLERAESKFDRMVAEMQRNHKITSSGKTSNYGKQ